MVTNLDVLLSVNEHVDERAETNQTLPLFHIALPGRPEWNFINTYMIANIIVLGVTTLENFLTVNVCLVNELN